jgi:hypothetical protein
VYLLFNGKLVCEEEFQTLVVRTVPDKGFIGRIQLHGGNDIEDNSKTLLDSANSLNAVAGSSAIPSIHESDEDELP